LKSYDWRLKHEHDEEPVVGIRNASGPT